MSQRTRWVCGVLIPTLRGSICQALRLLSDVDRPPIATGQPFGTIAADGKKCS